MDLETTGGEAMARLQELVPALDRGEEACGQASAALARARAEVAAHFEELAAAAESLRGRMLERRMARASRVIAEKEAVADLLILAGEYRRDCDQEVKESGLAEVHQEIRDHRAAQSERQRETSARQAALLHEVRQRRDRLQARIDEAPAAIRGATERVAAFRERVALRAEETRAFMIEQCLPRLEERMAAFAERLADLQDQMSEALRAGGERVAETAEEAMTDGVEAFEAMSATMAAAARMWEQSLGTLAGATIAGTGGVEQRQEDWSAQTVEIGRLFEESGVALGEALEAFSRLAITPGFGPVGAFPLPFPNLPR